MTPTFGAESISGWAREIPQMREGVLFAAALRSSKVDGLVDRESLAGIRPREVSMPQLADTDIDALISVLDANNRLGILKGKNYDERVAAFRKEAGRQLLVAMIQATSGKRFKQKAIDEFAELTGEQKAIYASICLTSSQRFSLEREEILLALGSSSNETLNALEKLVRRHLVVRQNVQSGYITRHRVIADEIVNAMQFRSYIGPVLEGVCFAFANRVSPTAPRSNWHWRRLIRFINHDFLINMASIEDGRRIYARLEQSLHWDWHYWLQRGSLEVEEGDLTLATNFLDQARSLAPGERMVETEYAYLLMKRASSDPRNIWSREWFDEGRQTLEALIADYGKRDPYPYHVLGSQGLAWAHHALLPLLEKQALLRHLLDVVDAGVQAHPRATELPPLAQDLKREWLSTTVTTGPSSRSAAVAS